MPRPRAGASALGSAYPRGASGLSCWAVLVAAMGAMLAIGCSRGKRPTAAGATPTAGSTDVVGPPPVPASRRPGDDGPDWTAGTLPWDRWPIDVSWMNAGDRPAGRHGKLHADGERLVFADGTPARFWGTNVAARALFLGSREAIANQARRIAALGYNLVRIHHQDSQWVVPNVFQKGATTQVFDEAALEKLDWWVKCLEDQGVYLWIDLQVGRRFLPGDNVPGFEEIQRQSGDARGFDYVNPRLEALMADFAAQYLGRVNRFTGRALKDDPAVAAVLITNEDDLTTHFGGRLAPTSPLHRRLLEAAAKPFVQGAHLPWPGSLDLWKTGPPKILASELEARFYERAVVALRRLGLETPIVPTSYWGGEDLSALPALTVGDIMDVHAYGEEGDLTVDPQLTANFMAWIGAAHVEGKPLSISEWNVEYPKRDRFIAPLYVAAIASLQGWTAPMLYNYMQTKVETPRKLDIWSTAWDPALTALTPAAAVMFRQQHVQQAVKTYRFAPPAEVLYGRALNPTTSATLRTLVEKSRLVIALPDMPKATGLRGPVSRADAAAITITSADQNFLDLGTAQPVRRVVSDTGEVTRDWGAGIETIDTPRSQAAAGRIGGKVIALGDVELRVETPDATVAFTSLDGRAIASSRRILLTIVGPVVASPGETLPLLAQRVRGSFSLRSVYQTSKMTALSPSANPTDALPDSIDDSESSTGRSVAGGRQEFQFGDGMATHWFLIEPLVPERTAGPRQIRR